MDFKIKKPKKLLASLLIVFSLVAIASWVTSTSVNGWYLSINKPVLTPPSWVFPVAWTILYFLMALALYLVWSKGTETKGVKSALVAFGIQLGLNILWTPLFFGLNNILLALIDIYFLLIAIVITIVLFHKVSKKAAYLLIPYLVWVTFAIYLTQTIFLIN